MLKRSNEIRERSAGNPHCLTDLEDCRPVQHAIGTYASLQSFDDSDGNRLRRFALRDKSYDPARAVHTPPMVARDIQLQEQIVRKQRRKGRRCLTGVAHGLARTWAKYGVALRSRLEVARLSACGWVWTTYHRLSETRCAARPTCSADWKGCAAPSLAADVATGIGLPTRDSTSPKDNGSMPPPPQTYR